MPCEDVTTDRCPDCGGEGLVWTSAGHEAEQELCPVCVGEGYVEY
jgi:hypothetical protein